MIVSVFSSAYMPGLGAAQHTTVCCLSKRGGGCSTLSAILATTRAIVTGSRGVDSQQQTTQDVYRREDERDGRHPTRHLTGQPKSTAPGVGSSSEGEIVFDFTDESISSSLPRAAATQKPDLTKATSPSRLDAATRQMLIRALHQAEHSRQIVVDAHEDRASKRYEAALELQWMEQWAASQLQPSVSSSPDSTYRRLVKKAVLQRVDLHKPLSYIVGSQPFCGCDIRCEQPLLCPQFQTELWTYWVIDTILSKAATRQPKSLQVLDMCCGTGCVGVAVAKHVPTTCVTAVDVLEEAVQMTLTNARHNLVESARLIAKQSDMFDAFLSAPITCPDVKAHRTAAATSTSSLHTSTVPPAAPSSCASFAQSMHSSCDVTGNTRSHMNNVLLNEEKKSSSGGSSSGKGNDSFVTPAMRVATTDSARGHSGDIHVKRSIRPEWVHRLDMIVCHPPYILPDQYDHLPAHVTLWQTRLALVGTELRESCHHSYFQELCEYGAVMLKTRRQRDAVLRWQPNICMEVGLQACVVASMMERSGLWEDVHVHLDHRQHPRWISANSLP